MNTLPLALLLKLFRLNLTAVFSVNFLFRISVKVPSTAMLLLPTSATVRPRTLFTTFSTTRKTYLSAALHNVSLQPIRLDGSRAHLGQYVDDMILAHDVSNLSESHVSSDQQPILLTGQQDLEPGDIIGTLSSQLLRVPWVLTTHDTKNDVAPLPESPMTPKPPRPDITAPHPALRTIVRTSPPPNVYVVLTVINRNTFFAFCKQFFASFAIYAAGWYLSAIVALGATLTVYADIVSLSKMN